MLSEGVNKIFGEQNFIWVYGFHPLSGPYRVDSYHINILQYFFGLYYFLKITCSSKCPLSSKKKTTGHYFPMVEKVFFFIKHLNPNNIFKWGSLSLQVFALNSKNIEMTHTWPFGCEYPYEIYFPTNLVYTFLQHLWDTQYKYHFIFFHLLKNFFTTPTWNSFWISFNFLLRFLGPPGTPLGTTVK